MIETTTSFSILSFQCCGKQTKVGGGKRERKCCCDDGFTSHSLKSDFNPTIQVSAAQVIFLENESLFLHPETCIITDFQQSFQQTVLKGI